MHNFQPLETRSEDWRKGNKNPERGSRAPASGGPPRKANPEGVDRLQPRVGPRFAGLPWDTAHPATSYNPERVEAPFVRNPACGIEDDFFVPFSQGGPTTANPGLEAAYPLGVKERNAQPAAGDHGPASPGGSANDGQKSQR